MGVDDILKGEYLLINTTCALVNRVNNDVVQEGRLLITNYKLLFIKSEGDDTFRASYFKADLFLIHKLERISDPKKMVLGLDLTMKDMRVFRFRFLWSDKEEFNQTHRSLSRVIVNEAMGDQPAFDFFKHNQELESKHQGWQIYDARAEYLRQKVKVNSEEGPDDSTCAFKYVVNDKA